MKRSQSTQPANNTRLLLLQEGMQLAREKGLRGLAVRELAVRAQVNLGSFVYHFGTRDQFIRELVELWYAPIYEQIKHIVLDGEYPSAMARLEKSFSILLELFAQNANFVRHILADAIAGEAAAHQFLLSLTERHPKLILELVRQAQKEGSLIDEPPLHLMLFVMSAVQTAVIAGQGPLQNAPWLPPQAHAFLQIVSAPEAAKKRLQWALKGIKK